jgi:hypothetical protein
MSFVFASVDLPVSTSADMKSIQLISGFSMISSFDFSVITFIIVRMVPSVGLSIES